ncbi:c-type cytochrome [Bradyrhizobium manausense]|uniref:Alcohol dehydrogenase n=1 Tax=Bradyrhizobium manausense TaxID=989370 RepID=A0A0R3DGW3_9BRAD|nr:c-type cytochrome [Bradyrhizobium manausense]KRQ09123.1 alcohol dehydrogenase [Bradyrhizobium manausense]
MRRAAQFAFVMLTFAVGVSKAMSADVQNFAAVERGRYLAAAADCGSCHTVPGSDHPFSGGRPIETPFGVLVAPNITPDRETGIGAWTDEEFDAAARKGMRRDGKRLYPAMPFPYFARMTQEDVKDIRAYLSTVEPVHNSVAANQLPFPLNQRMAMTVWDKLYFKPGEFMEQRNKSKQWNRGAYLVEGPGHCGACHTPKTVLGGDKSDKPLQGYTLQGWVAPDITSGQGPLAEWSADDLAQYLKTGHNRFAAAAGLMGEVVELSTSRLSDDDTKAMAAYLKDVSGPKAAADSSADAHVMAAGGAIYQDLCSACHKSDGSGVPNLIPNLAHAATVNTGDPTTVLRVILQGAQSVATDKEPTGPAMPAFGWQLNDVQVAAVATYVRNHWGKAPPVSADQAKKERAALDARTN